MGTERRSVAIAWSSCWAAAAWARCGGPHDTGTHRVVAIKVLPAHLSEADDFQRRFRREAHAAARLDTPHVVPIYDYGEIDGRLFVSMRLINGRDLADVLADGPLDQPPPLDSLQGQRGSRVGRQRDVLALHQPARDVVEQRGR